MNFHTNTLENSICTEMYFSGMVRNTNYMITTVDTFATGKYQQYDTNFFTLQCIQFGLKCHC